MKAADGVPIAESIRVAVREKAELITGWYEGDGREHERLEEACGQWAMAEERERVLREALTNLRIRFVALFDSYVRKTYVGSNGDRDLRIALMDTDAALIVVPEQGKEAKS